MEQTPRPNNHREGMRPPGRPLSSPTSNRPISGGNLGTTRPSGAPGTSRAGGTGAPASRPKPPGGVKKRSKKVPGWAKGLIIAGLIFGSLIFGLMIGYTFVGKGPVGDVFSFSTWKHILDLIFG